MPPSSGPNTESISELNELIKQWKDNQRDNNWDPAPVIKRIAEIMELESNNYLKTDPDPFDERHPTRVNPLCTLGQLFKIICKQDSFMDKVVLDYTRDNYWQRTAGLSRDSTELNTHAARLLFDIMPGLETSAVFQDAESLIRRLFSWSEHAPEPLRSYATGLLASAMEVQDIAGNFREANARMVPLVMSRLKALQNEHFGVLEESASTAATVTPAIPDRPFAHISSRTNAVGAVAGGVSSMGAPLLSPPHPLAPAAPSVYQESNSNSSWLELRSQLIGTFQVYPLTPASQQILLLRYLTPLGEYQEWLSHVFEQKMMGVVFRYINFRINTDARLAFEALKYLSALLCHKRFILDFLNNSGLELLLEIPRPGIAATGMSMCLYYLAYSEDAMERICQSPEPVITRLVRYALWLLECSHESGRCHAIMCFGLNFQFRPILEQFDRQDGLRKLLNVVSTLRILTTGNVDNLEESDDEFTARQTMRHVCFTLKCYLEAHLVIRARELKRGGASSEERSPSLGTAGHLSLKVTPEIVQESLDMLLGLMPLRARWRPAFALYKLGGIKTLLQIIDISQDIGYSAKSETIRSALDAINICCVLPAAQLQLAERHTVPGERSFVGMALIVNMAETELNEPEVQKSALRVLITCVYGPNTHRSSGSSSPPLNALTSSAKKRPSRPHEDLLPLMWDTVRNNNGIMALMSLLHTKTPITDADSVRALACRALVGLARSESARQIMSKLPLFTTSQLQMVIREPILQEKRAEHVQLQRDALELVELVSGRSKRLPAADTDITMDTIHRANVVAQTRIRYNEKQLLQLIHNHLVSKGLAETASVLQAEASLPVTTPKVNHPVHPPPVRLTAAPPSTPRQARTPGLASRLGTSSDTPRPHHVTPADHGVTPSQRGQPDRAAPPQQPLHIRVNHNRGSRVDTALSPVLSPVVSRSGRQKLGSDSSTLSRFDRPAVTPSAVTSASQSVGPTAATSSTSSDPITLDRVVTEYLMNQHALCRNPMVTCPQFDLFEPHRCPELKSKHSAPANFAMRLCRRPIFPAYGGPDGRRQDVRLIFSRYCPVRTFREFTDDDSTLFTCATFTPEDMKYVMIGTQEGTVKAFSLETGEVEETYAQLHASSITHLQVNRSGSLMLTSSRRRRPLSALWSIENVFENKANFADDEYVEFSKQSQDRVLGTQKMAGSYNYTASVYDVATAQRVCQLTPRDGNGYRANRATFDPSDDLVLNNGVLFDVRAGKEIHKFDKFNNIINGVFHPNGLEIVANTEVWDLRTFHLLRAVPALQRCRATFTNSGHVIFGVRLPGDHDDSMGVEEITGFKVVDAADYTSIATVDVKRHVYDLSVNYDDRLLALVESQTELGDVELDQSCVRLYEVGRVRGEEDLDDQEEEENVDDTDGSDMTDNVASDLASALFDLDRGRDRDGDVSDSDASFVAGDGSLMSLSPASANSSASTAIRGEDSNEDDNSWVTEEEREAPEDNANDDWGDW